MKTALGWQSGIVMLIKEVEQFSLADFKSQQY